MGVRRIHIAAFPLHRRIASLWNRWVVVSAVGMPSLWPSSRPKLLMVSTARSLQPPIDSTTRGMKQADLSSKLVWKWCNLCYNVLCKQNTFTQFITMMFIRPTLVIASIIALYKHLGDSSVLVTVKFKAEFTTLSFFVL